MRSPQFSHHGVDTLYSVAHLFPKRARCGVYILRFRNDERYVGQAQNVVTRFSAHRRRWDDIDYLDFCPCPRAELTELEVEMIANQIRLGKVLRNITHALGPVGDSDLDPLITPDEQYAWLNSDDELQDVTERIRDTQHRSETRPKFRTLAKTPPGRVTILFMHMYVLATVPRPRQTERTFWALSALPATNGNRRFTTLSINKMETVFLVDFGDGKRGEGPVGGCINVSASAVAANYGLDAVAKDFPALSVDPAAYEAAGGDALSFRGELGPLLEVLMEPWFLDAGRRLNMTLMRKGPTFQWRWHCFDFADWVLREDLSEDDWFRAVEHGLEEVPRPRSRH